MQPGGIYAQSKEYTLRSGQRVSIAANGEFIRVAKLDKEEETTLINPFEVPGNVTELSAEEYQMLGTLKEYLEFREFELFRDSFVTENALIDLEIKRKSGELKNSNHRETKSKLLQEIKKINEENVRLAHYLRRLNLLKSLPLNERERLFNDIIKMLNIRGNEISDDANLAANYGDFTVDNRAAESIVNLCNYTVTSTAKKDLKMITHSQQRFFSFTPENLMNYFSQEDYMVTDISVSKVKNDYFLAIEFRFNNKDISRAYGTLVKGDFTRFNFLQGRKIFLKHPDTVNFRIEEYTGNTIYTMKYPLRRDYVKILKASPVVEMGVMWSTGFETYQIYNIDLLSNQIKCIEKAD
jgi:archaellin